MQVEAAAVLRRFRDELAQTLERAIIAETQVVALETEVATLRAEVAKNDGAAVEDAAEDAESSKPQARKR